MAKKERKNTASPVGTSSDTALIKADSMVNRPMAATFSRIARIGRCDVKGFVMAGNLRPCAAKINGLIFRPALAQIPALMKEPADV
jgi:hypothetical protein